MRRVRGVKLHGFEKVERNLNKALSGIKSQTTEAFIAVAKDIHYDADLTTPTIPVNTGDMRQSRFIVSNKGLISWGRKAVFKGERYASGGYKKGRSPGYMMGDHRATIQHFLSVAGAKRHPTVILGYTAWYAVYPHEMGIGSVRSGAAIRWTRPGSGPKFFQSALYRKAKNIPTEVYKKANVAGNRPAYTYRRIMRPKISGRPNIGGLFR